MGWLRRRRDRTRPEPPSAAPPPAPTGATYGCDVCSRDIRPADGFVLSTAQVSASEEYWRRYFETSVALMGQFLPEDEMDAVVSQAIGQVCGDPTRWIVCSDCVACFVVDIDEAHRLAGSGGSPDDLGPVAPADRAAIAGRAWRHLTGHWPRTVRPEQRPVDSCDLCAKPMYTDEPAAHMTREKVRSLVDDGLLDTAPPDTDRRSADGGPDRMACGTCLARLNARSRLGS